MHMSQATITLGVLQILMITMTVLQRNHVGRPPTEAVPGVSSTILSNAMPRTIAILIEADLIATMKEGIDISATLIQRGMNKMPIEVIFHRAGAHLVGSIPPVGGMTTTVQPRLITN